MNECLLESMKLTRQIPRVSEFNQLLAEESHQMLVEESHQILAEESLPFYDE
jgi:hypothetical protein